MNILKVLKHFLGIYTRKDYIDSYNSGKLAAASDFLLKEKSLYGADSETWSNQMYDFTIDYIKNL